MPSDCSALAAIAGALVALVPMLAGAGGWHRSEKLMCSDCHTMHNSSRGAAMRYDGERTPAQNLLRDATPLLLCIHCHDGTNPDAPDVIGERSAAYESVDPAGGVFAAPVGDACLTGHDLGPAAALAPPDGDTPVVVVCTTCHDPHGNDRYRNLRPNPSGVEGRVGGGPVDVDEVVVADGENPSAAYASSNMTYRRGMSQFCLDCHNRYEDLPSHPYDRTLSTSYFVSYSHWLSPLANRVRVQHPTDPAVPSDDDEVFCLSCHKAHGSRNADALIYPDGVNANSACNQCHDK